MLSNPAAGSSSWVILHVELVIGSWVILDVVIGYAILGVVIGSFCVSHVMCDAVSGPSAVVRRMGC